jgi:hypothetical protein
MLEWFRRRGQRPKRLAEMTPDELDAMLADHPQLDALLRHTLGVMQFAPPKVAESVLQRIEEIIDETLRRRLSPEEEQDFVMGELETVRRMLAGQ